MHEVQHITIAVLSCWNGRMGMRCVCETPTSKDSSRHDSPMNGEWSITSVSFGSLMTDLSHTLVMGGWVQLITTCVWQG